MKNISLLLLLLSSHFLQAQTTFQRLPYDHIWVLNNSTIDFNFDPPLVELNNSELFFELTNTSICDTSGDIVFYSNNMSIFGNDNLLLENGDSINFNNYWQWRADNDRGYAGPQLNIALPLSANDTKFCLLHIEKEKFETDQGNKYFNLFK